MEEFNAKFPIRTDIKVVWGEMDALNHVNNVVYFRYFETARIDFLNQLNLLSDLQVTGIGPVVSETNARYKRPVTFPDTLTIGVSICNLQADRFTMHYTAYSHQQQTVTTLGWAKIVMFNFKTGQKAELSPAQLELIKPHCQ